MSYLTHITLTRFRNYTQASLKGLERGFVVLSGHNGVGKTNCLEAVSLLSPGRGLRNASLDDLRARTMDNFGDGFGNGFAGGAAAAQSPDSEALHESLGNTVCLAAKEAKAVHNQACEQPAIKGWVVLSDIESDAGAVRLGTGEDSTSGKRIAKINGERVSALSQMADYVACVWFTPAMSGLFTGGAAERRRFFDRLVFAYDPAHAGRIRRYEQAMAQRARVLKDAHHKGVRADATWLDGLELSMAETGVAIAASRLELLSLLQDFCAMTAQLGFPQIAMDLVQGPEAMLQGASALTVEENLRAALSESRRRDAIVGGAALGAHKTDLHVVYAPKAMEAAQCSTGEQKALLMGIILAHARFIEARRGEMPVLLLDEVAAHLDPRRRATLFDILGGMKGQVWLSGTEHALFEELSGKGQFFEVANQQFHAL